MRSLSPLKLDISPVRPDPSTEPHSSDWADTWGSARGRQVQVKLTLLAVDLLFMWSCFLFSRLFLWAGHPQGFVQGALDWWATQGALRSGVFAIVSLLGVVWLGAALGHYNTARRSPWWDETRQLTAVMAVCAAADAASIYFGKWQYSRLWTGTTWALIVVLLPFVRLLVQHWLVRNGRLVQPYVVVGTPDAARLAAAALGSEPLMGYRPVGLVLPATALDSGGPRDIELAGHRVQIQTYCTAVGQRLAQCRGCQVLIAMDGVHDGWLRTLAQELMLSRDDVLIIPSLAGLPLIGMEMSHFFSHEVLLLRARNNLQRRTPQLLKRLLDLVLASGLLVLAAPLMGWIAWRIRREDGGPVLFVQPRVGRGGEHFPFIKFRSMVLDADQQLQGWRESNPELYAQYRDNNFKLARDPRVTRIGRFIRRTSMDELPQLLNVLRGDMSLVGPRPLLPREQPDYGTAIHTYQMARPGITGLWQISGRSNTGFGHRIAMDLWYLRNWSAWYDFVILLRTVRVVLRQEGAV